MAVTFWGHRDCSEAIRTQFQQVLEELIAEGADGSYVGSQGRWNGISKQSVYVQKYT